MSRRLLTFPEVAAELRMPEAGLRWRRHRGDGPPMFKLAGRLVAYEDEVVDWIERQRAAEPRRPRGRHVSA